MIILCLFDGDIERAKSQGVRHRTSTRQAVVHYIHEHCNEKQHEATRESICARKRAVHGPRPNGVPQVVVAEFLSCLFSHQKPECSLLLLARYIHESIDGTTTLFYGKPVVQQEIALFSGLQVMHDYVLEEPGCLAIRARIVVPDM